MRSPIIIVFGFNVSTMDWSTWSSLNGCHMKNCNKPQYWNKLERTQPPTDLAMRSVELNFATTPQKEKERKKTV